MDFDSRIYQCYSSIHGVRLQVACPLGRSSTWFTAYARFCRWAKSSGLVQLFVVSREQHMIYEDMKYLDRDETRAQRIRKLR